ncbi:MAG: radical SAM protein [Paludibacter sp.]
MKITFLIPPAIDGNLPAERTSGCTHVVYATPNMYELTVVGLLEREGYKHEVFYEDFVYDNQDKQAFVDFLSTDNSTVYLMWSVNLSIKNDMLVVDAIRATNPDAYVLFMGPGSTYFIKDCLRGERDIVVRGEPDITVLEFINALRDGNEWNLVDGISYLQNGKKVDNKSRELIRDLDTLALPARHFIQDRVYRNPKLKLTPYTVMVTSRNCPYKCIFCVPSSLTFAREIENRREFGKKPPISFRSVESINMELQQLHADGYKAIGFMDDNFIWNEPRTLAICASLRKYGFKWGCQARVDAITENIAKALGESDCQYVDLGVESFDDEVLKYIKKGITREQIYKAIALLKKYHVPVKLNILIGTSPLETKETLRDTLRQAQKLKVDQIMFNIVSPFPGTEFYLLAKQNGWITTGEYVATDVQRESILSYPHLSAKEMEKILYWNNIQYFLSPNFVFRQLKRFRSLKEFLYALKVLRVKLFG